MRFWVRRSRPSSELLILLYHRVAEVEVDPWGLCLSPRHFDEQLELIQSYGPVLTLAEAVQALRDGTLPRRATVVTFDDGYADNFYAAKPLLERHGIPATFFLTTGAIGSSQEFWWDELERVVLGPTMLPSTLRLTLDGEAHEWELEDGALVETPRGWRAWEAPPTARHALYYALWQRLIERPYDEQQDVLAALRAWAGVPAAARFSHRTMTPDEVADLARSPLVEVGAHTVTHPALPALPVARQRTEIAEGKAYLERLLGRSISTFSYPYGRCGTEATATVAELGFACGCTTEPHPVRPGADPFLLPRVQVLNGDGEALARQIDAWLHTP
jgi:peptidoglycan/xylan/chitin deacetylase (PgdA/CDA1 family)